MKFEFDMTIHCLVHRSCYWYVRWPFDLSHQWSYIIVWSTSPPSLKILRLFVL